MKTYPIHTFDVDGWKVSLSALPARQNLRLGAKLLSSGAMNGTHEDFFKAMNEDLVEEVRRLFSAQTTINGTPIGDDVSFDMMFSGQSKKMMLWLVGCLKAEYSGFFDGVANGLSDQNQRAQNSPIA